ncbi:MAG: DUF1549 domain-containing protein, partial [Pirellula sp.]
MISTQFLLTRLFVSIVALLMAGHSIACFAAGPKSVASWEFGTEETSRVQFSGTVQRDVAGPRSPMFPEFSENNTAIRLGGDGSRVVLEDPGEKSLYDFNNGDTISIDAWVSMDGIGERENRYVIGKGRTHQKGFDRDNQNWALRICGIKGKGAISFLFATPQAKSSSDSNQSSHWHRWTSQDGFAQETLWHHVAVSYKFGDPNSIRGWIDGVAVSGTWDMGGATDQAPVVDDDQVWIGASMGGNSSTSFRGSLDSISLYREPLTDEFIKTRSRRNGPAVAAVAIPEIMPDLGPIPTGVVQCWAHESLAAHNRWLAEGESVPPVKMTWNGDEFLLPRLPFSYDESGVRDGWKTPVLLRMAADVQLRAGKNKLLLRARGLSRLWLDGKVIARTGVLGGSTDGHQPVKPIARPPLPGLQSAGYEMQEAIEEIEVPSEGVYRVVLESILGGKKFRAVPGEMCVAVQTADEKSYTLLQSHERWKRMGHGSENRATVGKQSDHGSENRATDLTQAGHGSENRATVGKQSGHGSENHATDLTDEQMKRAVARVERQLSDLDTATRRQLSQSQAEYWNKRHAGAKQFAIINPPRPPKSASANPIDAFIADKIQHTLSEAQKVPSAQAKHFQSQIRPLLNEHCMRCHGKKESGGLRLDDRERAMAGGESGDKAIVPGNSHASLLMTRIRSQDPDERMPPGERGLSDEQIRLLEGWIQDGAAWSLQLTAPESLESTEIVGDESFLRRVTLDTIGLPPTAEEVKQFVSDKRGNKREMAIDRLLKDPRWADHWVSYWQEVLAENPNMLKPSLNNSGPFRWFLHESFLDGKSMDRIVTELIMLKGSDVEIAHDDALLALGHRTVRKPAFQ